MKFTRVHNGLESLRLSVSAAVIYLPQNNMTLLASILTFGLSSVSISGLSLLPPFQEGDVPGSTDGILLMGILIVLIVVVPIVWTRRKWMR